MLLLAAWPQLGAAGPAAGNDEVVATGQAAADEDASSGGAGGEEADETIVVVGDAPSMTEVLEQSAEAVDVVETDEARRESADMGDLLARSEGVGVRRGGGLGSGERISLAGLTGKQVRFFVDGVPLEMTGFALGLGNVPVNLIERVEIYRGVVPVRFGVDALGGAFNLVTERERAGTGGTASYQVGSFGTHRVTLGARHRHEESGLYARVHGFGDFTRNDYPVDVEVPDERGRLEPATVERFHDDYRATGGGLEVGIVDRPWADRLAVETFATDHDKELQHNAVMSVPYGEVTYGERRIGGTARYDQPLAPDLRFHALAGYAHRRTRFLDVGEWVYDWYGERIRERARAGEIESRPRDQVHWQHGAMSRLALSWTAAPHHRLRLAVSPTFTTRTGDERRQTDPEARDPLTAERDLFTLVTGAEYESDWLGDRLENIAFAKGYLYIARTEEPVAGGGFARRDKEVERLGIGDGIRYRITGWLDAKASYEWATRLPGPDEVFGDGVLVIANLELEPETSHNVNVGADAHAEHTRIGSVRGELTGFARHADQLIVLLGNDQVFSHQNVFAARSVGVEGAAGWTSPAEHVALDANVTWQDFRNTSDEGTFGDFEGDRIPNRPYLFANGVARVAVHDVVRGGDEVTASWKTRYVHEFFRGWESVGLREFKQTVPSQLVHAANVAYVARTESFAMSTSLEVQNVTDERTFDFFGVQRPGRAFFVKTTVEL